MRVDLFDFELPPERIALRPVAPRDSARMLCVGADTGAVVWAMAGDSAAATMPSKRIDSFENIERRDMNCVPQRTG